MNVVFLPREKFSGRGAEIESDYHTVAGRLTFWSVALASATVSLLGAWKIVEIVVSLHI